MQQTAMNHILDSGLQVDGEIMIWVQNHLRTSLFTPIMQFFSFIGEFGAVWILLAIIMLCMRRYRKTGATMLLALIFGFIFTNLILKNLVDRPRPYEVLAGLTPIAGFFGIIPTDPSFPSGHTTAAFAAAWAFTANRNIRPIYRFVVWVAAIFTAFSRLYMGVHYPSDIIGAIIVAAVCAFLAGEIVGDARRNLRKRDRKSKLKAAKKRETSI